MFYSPLRYPGGKNRLSKFISKICVGNNIEGHYVEPYAGGASVALYLLLEGRVKSITINDFDKSIYAFWRCALNYPNKICQLIEEAKIDIETWQIQKEIQRNKNNASIFELGFSTLFLNRTNISGIINAGVIGGLEQNGQYKIDCRFNKKTIISRIKQIAKYKKQIKLYNLNALELVSKIQIESGNNQTIFYFDPPYYQKGSSLYMNFYNDKQHQELAKAIKKINNIHWIVSYDDTQEILNLYNWVLPKKIKKYTLNHFAYRRKIGKEILFFSKNLKINTNEIYSNNPKT